MARERPSREAMAARVAGGIKGGKSRARNLSPERRSEIARMAAAARWEKESVGKERGLANPIVVELICTSSRREYLQGGKWEAEATFITYTGNPYSKKISRGCVMVAQFNGADFLPGRMYRITVEEIEPGD